MVKLTYLFPNYPTHLQWTDDTDETLQQVAGICTSRICGQLISQLTTFTLDWKGYLQFFLDNIWLQVFSLSYPLLCQSNEVTIKLCQYCILVHQRLFELSSLSITPACKVTFICLIYFMEEAIISGLKDVNQRCASQQIISESLCTNISKHFIDYINNQQLLLKTMDC